MKTKREILLLIALAIPTILALTTYRTENESAVQVEGEGFSAVVVETESGNVQERGEEILRKMVEVNQYWLFGPTSDVKNYSYEFLLVDNAPRTIEVSKPANTSSSFRQGISYYTVLHKLASEPASAVITAIQEDGRTIRLDFSLKDSMKIACGNGISGTWRGYFSSRVDMGSLWLDAEKMVPIKTVSGQVEEYFSNYVTLEQFHYVPLVIRIDQGDMHFIWKFNLYEPGLWLFDMADYQLREEGVKLPVASVENVKINTKPAQQNQLPVVIIAQTDESTSLRRMLAEGRKRMEMIIKTNHTWLLPSLDIRQGLVYQYRQEEPYFETVMFDEQGNIMVQLESSKESPDAPTRQLFYQPDGTFIRTRFDEEFVRLQRISDDEQILGQSLIQKDRYVRNLATGLNFDCALTRMARNPEIFHAKFEQADDNTYRLMLTTSSREAKIFTGTMLTFTSWAYMHDVRYAKTEIVCDAETDRPLSEKDYDVEGNLVGSYTFSNYLESPSGGAPGRIKALIPYLKDDKDQSLEMDAVFEFVRPSLWLLRTCHSEFHGQESGSVGEVKVVPSTEQSFQPLNQLLARFGKTNQILSRINNAGEGRFVTSLRFDNSIPVWTRAIWAEKAEGYLSDLKDTSGYDKPIIAVVETQCTRLDNDRIKVTLNLFSNIYWKEFETVLIVDLLDSNGRELFEATTFVKLRTEGSPRMTKTTVEFSDIEDIGTIDKIAVSATVKRMTAMYHGHGVWMSFMDQ